MRNSPWSLSIQIDFTSGLATISAAARGFGAFTGYYSFHAAQLLRGLSFSRAQLLAEAQIRRPRELYYLNQESLRDLNQESLGGCHSSHAQAASRNPGLILTRSASGASEPSFSPGNSFVCFQYRHRGITVWASQNQHPA